MQVLLRWLTATLAISATFAVTATAADAATNGSYRCDAQGLNASLLGQGLLQTGTAGSRADVPCASSASGIGLSVPGLVSVGAISASTSVTPAGRPAAEQTATAASSIANADVALTAVVPVASVRAVQASAVARCSATTGAPTLTGASRVEGLRVLGQALPDLDPTLGSTFDVTNGLLGFVATVDVNRDTTEGGRLVRRAVRVRVLPLGGGTAVADVTIGRAAVSGGDVDCAQVSPQVRLEAAPNRTLSAAVDLAPGATLESGSFAVRPVGSTDAPTTVPGTIAGGRFTATLPRDAFPAGTYEVVATATDSVGRTGRATGPVVVAVPAVGSPAFDDRDVSAPVTAPAGTAIASCDVALTPAGSSTSTSIGGSYDAATGRCSATAPDGVPSGDYSATVTATDGNGDAGTGTATGAIGAVASGPTVALLDSGTNRVVTARTTAGLGGAVTGCTLSAGRPGSTPTALATTFDASSGRCSATLPRDAFPVGTYAVTASATDGSGRTGTASGTTSVGQPVVGTPVVDGRRVSAPVTPAAGVPVSSCSITLRAAGSTTDRAVGGDYDAAAGTCSATVPATVAAGTYAVTTAVVDANGDRGTATGTGRVGVAQPDGRAPVVTLLDGQANRRVAARVVVDPARRVSACTILATPVAGGATKPVPATYDAASGECRGVLAAGAFGPGDVRVTVVAVDSAGESGAATGTLRVGLPEIGTPVVDGPTVTVPVTPATGTTIAACTLVLTPAGGGAPVRIVATYDPRTQTCSGTVPAGTATGGYTLVTTATDSDGAQASDDAAVTLGSGAGSGGSGVDGGANSRSTPTTPAPTDFATANQGDLLTACTVDRLLLTQVYVVGSRVRIVGAAESSLIGKTVSIRLGSSRVAVAKAKVSKDGVFIASAKAPRKALRSLRTTRYQAVSGTTFSKRLKLTRRLSTTAIGLKAGRVVIRGQATRPLARARQVVKIQRLVRCGVYETVGTTRLTKRGTFAKAITPPKANAAIYRAQTKVARTAGGRATVRTFTLPGGVTLRK